MLLTLFAHLYLIEIQLVINRPPKGTKLHPIKAVDKVVNILIRPLESVKLPL